MSRKAQFRDNYGHNSRDLEESLHRIRNRFNNFNGRKNKFIEKNLQNSRFSYQDDIDMSDRDGFRKGRPHNNRKFRGGNRFEGAGRLMMAAGVSLKRGHWFQVKIVYGARYSREENLAKLQNHLGGSSSFHPVCYQVMGQDSQFYVERFETAQSLLSCTRKVYFSDGQPMIIKIKEFPPPLPPTDNVLTDKLKSAMVKRYNGANKALDLSYFVRDPEFLDGFFVSLNRPTIAAATLKIVLENIPDLLALNLAGNSIYDLEVLSAYIKKFKNLRILFINDNSLAHVHSLNCLKETEITELRVEKNPFVNKFAEKAHFVRYEGSAVTEVRKRLPKLKKLDNTELAPVVEFDLGDEAKFPPSQAAFVVHQDGRAFIKAFLSQYFQIFDSDNRKNIIQAYADNACFSFNAFYPPTNPTLNPKLNHYFADTRNLLRISDFPRRRSRLYVGKHKIVEILAKMPKTQHDLLSFAVDLPIFMPELISLSVTGIFREIGDGTPSSWPYRYFSRTFLIVTMGTGFCIVNEMLAITNATEDQVDVAFKTVPAVEAISSAPSTSSPTAAQAAPVIPDETIQLQMIQALAQQTGMNLEWSKRCLDETKWNYDLATYTFAELQKQGTIPPEAFVK